MKSIAALPVLFAFLVGALPAHAWTWPVAGPVLQPFQLGSDPYAAGQHRGIDVGAPPGTTVVAPAGGVVSFAGTVPRSGRTITIATPDGLAVTLVHLGAIAVARGTTVEEGAPVGAIGPSGDPEHAEAYVHLGVRVATDPHGYVDPESLLPAPAAPAPAEEAEEAEVPGPAESPGDEVPSEPPVEEESPLAEPEGGSETGTPQPDPAGEAESPSEPGAEEVPSDPPREAEPVPEPGESTPVPTGEEPAEAPVEPDRIGVEAPAASAEGLHPPSGHTDAPGLEERSREPRPDHRQSTPAAETPVEVDAAPAAPGDARISSKSLPDESAPASSQVSNRGARGQANSGAGVSTVLAAAIGAAALTALGAVLGAKRRRGSRLPTEPITDDLVPAVSSQEMPGEHPGRGGAASAELDLWLAELLGPRTPCPSRLVRGGHANARRRPPPRRRVTPWRAAPAQGARSARAGLPPRGSRTRS